MGNNIESLKESQIIRSRMIAELGCIPTSIMRRLPSRSAIDKSGENKSYTNSNMEVQKRLHPLLRLTGLSAQNQGVRAGALSRFPWEIGRLITLFYTKKGDTVYDPFAGHNSRMQLVYECERNYIGVDICKEFMVKNREVKASVEKTSRGALLPNKSSIRLIEGSSANVPSVINNSCDFTITSPPYWDLEYYGDEPEQLGTCKTYETFLKKITPHITENFRILKPGAFCCWFVNDFVKKNVFYPYHSDLIPLFCTAGFLPFTIYIVDMGSPLGAIFAQSIIKSRRFAKQHEYCLVFQKPITK